MGGDECDGWVVRILDGVVLPKLIEKQMQVLRVTTPKLKNAWGPVRSE